MFGQMGLQLSSDMSMRMYSVASIAENPLLAVVGDLQFFTFWKRLSVYGVNKHEFVAITYAVSYLSDVRFDPNFLFCFY